LTRNRKEPFDIERVFRKVGIAIEPFPKAAMFQLAEEGFSSPFEQLIACLISVRTRDETTIPIARRLFAIARAPSDIARLTIVRIGELIHGTAFREVKAGQIWNIARRVAQDYDGKLPCDETILRSFSGVGPKCAHLVLGIACRKSAISVDIHVHRVTNRDQSFVGSFRQTYLHADLTEVLHLPSLNYVPTSRRHQASIIDHPGISQVLPMLPNPRPLKAAPIDSQVSI
jgi:endonuclease III